MKQIITLSLLLGLVITDLSAQSNGFNYQAVLRDAQGELLTNTELALILTLKDTDGTTLFSERHDLSTNELGQLNTMIGSGTVEQGIFSDIVGVQQMQLQVEAILPDRPDPVDFGTAPVGTVPYALYGADEDADPKNEMQRLSIEGDSLKISDMPAVSLSGFATPWKKVVGEEAYQLDLPDESGRGVQLSKVMEIGCDRVAIFNEDGSVHLGFSSEFKSLADFDAVKQKQLKKLAELFGDLGAVVDENSRFSCTLSNGDVFSITLESLDVDFFVFIHPGRIEYEITAPEGTRVTGSMNDDCSTRYSSASTSVLSGSVNDAVAEALESNGLDTDALDDRSVKVVVFEDGFSRDIEITSAPPGGNDIKIRVQQKSSSNDDGTYGTPKIKKLETRDQSQENEEKGDVPITGRTSKIDQNSSIASRHQTNESGSAQFQYGTDQEPDNGRAAGEPLAFLNMLKNDQFAAGLLASGTGDAFAGTMSTSNHTGPSALIGAWPGLDQSLPFMALLDGGELAVVSTTNAEGVATTTNYGGNRQPNVTVGTFAGEPNGGAVISHGEDGGLGAYIWTKGDGGSQIGADVFVMNTSIPQSSAKASYAAPVSGEAAAYDRGTATLVNGEATIVCPEHFQWIADEKSMTVTITPLSAESKGIAVIEKSNGGFKVKELHGGLGNYSFDYLVMCKRKGYQDFQVMQTSPQKAKENITDLHSKLPQGFISNIVDYQRQKEN